MLLLKWIKRKQINLGRLLLLSLSVILLLWLMKFLWKSRIEFMKCSDAESRRLLEMTCNWYRQGLIVGSLCPLMCEKKKVKFEKCANHYGKTVLLMTCVDVCKPGDTVPAMLKSYFADIEQYNKIFQEYDDIASTNLSEFKTRLKNHIWVKQGVNTPLMDDVIKSVFQWDYNQYINPPNTQKYKAFTLSVWSLVEQDEYIITKLHQHNPLFPQIYHSCGSFYLMESAPPGDILGYTLYPWKLDTSSWKERANIAIKLLDAILTMESEFHQTLHMCDLKGDNFGVGRDGVIKLIDTDDSWFDEALSRSSQFNESRKKPCLVNEECDAGDCHGICFNGVCSKNRLNNNLQALCNDVFNAEFQFIFNNGLLRNPPSSIKEELKILLNDCVYPDGSDQKATSKTYWNIYNLLKSTI